MRKAFILCSLMLLLSICAFSEYPFMNHDGFVVILGDLHFPFARDKVEAVVDQILGLSPNKVFILGDLTEMGSDYEFSELSKILQKLSSQGIGIYELLGNHDTRWSSRNRKGVEGFKSFSIRCGPFTFLGLDTSLYFEHYGHIGNRQIQWIESQLKETEGPVVMMAHHPFGGPSNFTDDGWKLMNLIDGSNVRLVLVGHGHSYGVNGRYNGAWFQMVGAAKDGWYTVLSWKGDESFLWALNIDGGCNLIKRIPLSEEKECHQGLLADLRDAGGQVQLHLEMEGLSRIKLTINNSVVKEFSVPGGVIDIPVETSEGDTCVFVKILAEGTDGFTEKYVFLNLDSAKLKWRFEAAEGVFSSPTPVDQKVCVADLSGTVYLLDEFGKVLWEKKLSGPILSSVVSKEGKLICGDVEGNLAAFDLESFEEIWSAKLNFPVFSLSTGQKVLAVGSGENLYFLDPEHGTFTHEFYMYGSVQAPAKFVAPYFLQTSWGGVLSVIEEDGKQVKNFVVGAGYETAGPCTPELFDGWIVFTNTSGSLHGQNFFVKSEKWRKPSLSVGYSSVEKDGSGNAYVSSIDGVVYKFNPVDGEILWSVNVEGQIYDSSPRMVKEKVLAVGTLDGTVFLIDTEEGKILGKFYLGPGFIFSKVCPYKTGILVASMSGLVAFIELP